MIEETGEGLRLTVKVHSPLGLHARPAARLAQEAMSFDAEVTLHCNGNSADARSILDLLTLGATSGSRLTLLAKGKDAHPCLIRMAELFSNGFQV